jgi:hypothetical protein
MSKELSEKPVAERVKVAEERLSKLAAHLETPIRDEDYRRVVLALGHRARSLFFAFIEVVEGAAPTAAMSLIRPMVEINIILRFFRASPKLHVELWVAEGDRQVLAFLNDHDGSQYILDRWGAASISGEIRARLKRNVAAARGKALAAGIPGIGRSGPVFPSTRRIVDYLKDPGAEEGYILAYRTLGWNVHAGYYAFAEGSFASRVGGLVSYSEIANPAEYIAARTLVTTTFASTLCIISTEIGLGIEDEADEINRWFVLEDRGTAGADGSDR